MVEKHALILHKSLTQPDLLMGGHRVGMILLGSISLILIFATSFHRVAVVTALLLVVSGGWLLRNRGAKDPRWWEIYFRHLRYQPSYLAHSTIHAKRKTARKPSVP